LQAPSAGHNDRQIADRSFLWLLGGITVAGLLLRVPSLANSLFGDELSSYFIVTSHSLGGVLHILAGHGVDTNPPLYFALAWLVERLGASVQALRSVSLVAGTAAIPLTYLLGRWTVGRLAGLAAAAVMACSPFMIFFSTEARAYALVTLLALASTLALLKALAAGRLGWWVGYAVCSCAAMYAHYTAVFVLAAQFGWAVLTHPGARRALIASNLAAAAGFLPWLPAFVRQARLPGASAIGFLQPFGPSAIRVDLGHWAIGHPYLPLSAVPGPFAIAILVSGCLLAGLAAVARPRRDGGRARPRRPSCGVALVLALALAMPVGLIVYSWLGQSLWDERNLAASWPGLAVAIGALINGTDGLLRWATVCLVIGGFAIGAIDLLSPDHQRPDYRAAAAFIRRGGDRGVAIVEAAAFTPGPITELEAAFGVTGQSPARSDPVLRIGRAPLSVERHAPPYASLPIPSGVAIARRATHRALQGTLFVVTLGAIPAAVLRAQRVSGSASGGGVGVAAFLRALPADLRLIQTKTFPGFFPVSVYVFSRSPRR
jgi:mannosyltransferase